MRLAAGVLLALILGLQGCQKSGPSPAAPVPGKSAALRNMEQVAIAAHRCWFASGDAAFRGYSFANELDAHAGPPRFLLVPRSNFGGRPLLVVQAEGAAGRVTAFGPLLGEAIGPRISADIARWAAGDGACAATA